MYKGKVLIFVLIMGIFPFSAFADCPNQSQDVCRILIVSQGYVSTLSSDYNAISSASLDSNCGSFTDVQHSTLHSGDEIWSYDMWEYTYSYTNGSSVKSWTNRHIGRLYPASEGLQIGNAIYMINAQAPVVGSTDDMGYCQSSPSCDDSEKLCEVSRVVNPENNQIVAASYVRFDDRADYLNAAQLDYISPNFDQNSDNYTTFVNINIVDSDCYCPDDTENLPDDLQNNFSISPPGENNTSAGVADKYKCAQQCYPKGYYYSADGNCICIDDNQLNNTSPADPSPGAPSDTQTADNPSDASDTAGWGQAIKGDLDNMIDQGNQHGQLLGNIADNLATVANNQGVIGGKIDGLGDKLGAGLDELGDSIGDGLDGLGDKLDEIKDNQEQGYELQGNADLPADNEYDSTVETVEEDSFADALGNYLSSSIPILSYIRGTSLQLSGASSSMSVNLWGETIEFDLAPMADILDTMGYILSGIAVIVAFGIIVGRG